MKPAIPLTDRSLDVERLKNGDICALRETVGLSTIDFVWLIGSLPHVRSFSLGKKGSDKNRLPLRDAALGVLTRVLSEQPELCPVPETPTFFEIFEKAAEHFESIRAQYGISGKLSRRRFALILGMSGWSGIQWSKEDNQSPVASRLFLLLNILIDTQGEDGMLWFLKIVDLEARSRGFEDGLYDVFRAGNWGSKKAQNEQLARDEEKFNSDD